VPHCNTLQYTATQESEQELVFLVRYALQHTAKHCNTLQHTTKHCKTLQNTAEHCNTLQHNKVNKSSSSSSGTLCNTLQNTATHCNTLQHNKVNKSVSSSGALPVSPKNKKSCVNVVREKEKLPSNFFQKRAL